MKRKEVTGFAVVIVYDMFLPVTRSSEVLVAIYRQVVEYISPSVGINDFVIVRVIILV